MAAGTATQKTQPSSKLSFTQIEALWIQAGGKKELAPTMAAVALAESGGGNIYAHNNNPATGDDSYGLWQINYYGANRQPRTIRYGPPENMYDPLQNARAAVDISGNSLAGIANNWSTYRSGAFISYLPQNSSGLSASEAWKITRAIVTAPAQVFHGVTGKNVHASPTGPNSLAGVTGLDSIGKDVMYAVIILGGGLVMITGLALIGIDLGIAAHSALTSTRPVRAARRITSTRANRQAQAAQSATRESRASELHSVRVAREQARVKTEKARATELRTRTRHRAALAKQTKTQSEAIERRAYIRGAADAAAPNLAEARRRRKAS